MFCTETGRMLLHANEEIARWRWAKKVLRLPAAVESTPADLWLCVCAYPGNDNALQVRVNGRGVGRISVDEQTCGAWQWRNVRLSRGVLRGGANEIVLSSDNAAMSGWMLGIEDGHAKPASFLSTDREKSWRNARMGAHGVLRGEYLVRVRSQAAAARNATPNPPIVYEDLGHPRLRELRELIPARIQKTRDRWEQVVALRTWLAQAWTYEAFGRSYSPWDPATVLAWTKGNWGHGRAQPIAMCVHYGVTFASLAASLGHRSRGVAITELVNGPHGHFMAEIWDDSRGKWILHDPNFDLHYEDEGSVPLSGIELADRARARRITASNMRRGPGFTSDCPRLNGLLNEKLATGASFAVVGVWRLNNVVAEPTSAPPNHGSVVYCETDFIWYAPGGDISQTEMFPHHAADRAFFEAPPLPPPRARKRGGRR